MNQAIQSGTLYVQDYVANKPSKLYTLDLATGKAALIGELATEVYDLVFVGQALYGLDKKDFGFRKTMKLIKIEPTTGQIEVIGDTWFDVVGMDYNPVDNKLYASAHRNYQLVEIDLKTGHGKPVVKLRDRDRLCGEIAFNSRGQAYISLIGTDLKKYLAICDLMTGEVSLIGDIGFPGLASMKFLGDTLYGVAGNYEGVGGSNGQVIRIDTTTGQGTLLTTTDPLGCWAGMAFYAGVTAPIPTLPTPINPPIISPPVTTIPPQPIPTPTPDPIPPKVPIAPKVPVTVGKGDRFIDQLSFEEFDRNPATDIVCVAPIRTMVRREEEIILIRRVRKVEEVDASPTCPTNTTQFSVGK